MPLRRNLRTPFDRYFHAEPGGPVSCMLCRQDRKYSHRMRAYLAFAKHLWAKHRKEVLPEDAEVFKKLSHDAYSAEKLARQRRISNSPVTPSVAPHTETQAPQNTGGSEIQPESLHAGLSLPAEVAGPPQGVGAEVKLEPSTVGSAQTASFDDNSASMPVRAQDQAQDQAQALHRPLDKFHGNQLPMTKRVTMTSKDCSDLDMTIANMVIDCGLSLTFVESEYFRHVLRFYSQYQPPDRERLATVITSIIQDDMHQGVSLALRDSWPQSTARKSWAHDLRAHGMLHPDVGEILDKLDAT